MTCKSTYASHPRRTPQQKTGCWKVTSTPIILRSVKQQDEEEANKEIKRKKEFSNDDKNIRMTDKEKG